MLLIRRIPSLSQLPFEASDIAYRSTSRRCTGLNRIPRLAQLVPAGSCVQRRHLTINQLDSSRDDRERVVILGSGWAGYNVARQLDPKKYQAVVVSPRSYFAFTPLLASTSVGTLEFRAAVEPVRSRRSNVDFFQGWADGVDFKSKTVTIEEAVIDPKQGLNPTHMSRSNETETPEEMVKKEEANKGRMFSLTYDKLVIAVGCYSQTFGTPGVKEHALFLKDVGDARKIRNRFLTCFEAAALPTTTDEMRKNLLNFAIVGGGPTGIEFAAELHDIITEDLARLYPELIPFHKITVYDVAPKVLPMFDQKLADYAMQTFKREGIHIKTKHHVEELRPGLPQEQQKEGKAKGPRTPYTLKVKEEGEIGVGMVVWSTGLMQNPFVRQSLNKVEGLNETCAVPLTGASEQLESSAWSVKKHPKTGSIITDDCLRVKLETEGDGKDNPEAFLKDVFALGDCGMIEGTAYPATAQVANQKADWLVKRLNKGDFDKSGFQFQNMGVLAYLGDWNALFQGNKGTNISGRVAWLIWRSAYLTKSISLRNKLLVPVYW
ncbi:external NADH-ubiquinone oxidoreductase 2 mitochondrial precursor [Delitschia confertaspora ATCC 74209]|uniref:External NADH-ubiquinone oxidoreductase 2 mitochondrial n=1 Tax=Delitschia confertaspora ATCC 74209 TaxID=1513339 RepID=A0A9P4JD53_9PLEO|nr:external NADH-ubiquinone oxidoreductase 2 mitochondrial precursor [Delitschia confertaspora ATCC 74209]